MYESAREKKKRILNTASKNEGTAATRPAPLWGKGPVNLG